MVYVAEPGGLVRAKGGEGPFRVVFNGVKGGRSGGVRGVGGAGVVVEHPNRFVGWSIVH